MVSFSFSDSEVHALAFGTIVMVLMRVTVKTILTVVVAHDELSCDHIPWISKAEIKIRILRFEQ